MPQDRIMIEVKDLAKVYGAKRAVDGISFDVPSGEVLGFLGPNGAGKSTTMKMLTCFIAPTAGDALVGGTSVLEHSVSVREMIGYLPESTPLYQDLTPLEYLQFASALRKMNAAKQESRLVEIVEVCGLQDVLSQPIGELSKGFKQRVGLAQAMIHDPPILILDEPTSGLDPNQIVEIRELIKEIGKEKTVILSTHILPEVQATCGRVIIINNGALVADGSPDELAHGEAGNTYRVVLAGDGEEPYRSSMGQEARQKLDAIVGVHRVTETDGEDAAATFIVASKGEQDLRREIFGCARDNQWVLLELHRQTASLEDVFRRLTTE